MKKVLCGWMMAVCILTGPPAMADALNIDFDLVMRNVWTSGIWEAVVAFNVLPPGFTILPEVCDINGGMDTSAQPVVMYPNGILDSDEFALISAILAAPSFDCTATGGTSHAEIHTAWSRNFGQAWYDLGGGVGGPEVLLPPVSMIPDVEYLFSGMMTVGDADTLVFPLTIMDLAVNDDIVNGIIGDPNLHVPNPASYSLMYAYLAWCGDADGDGCSNLHEYEYFYPRNGRAGYLNAAMNPQVYPPGCTGNDTICNGTGGLFGEYFNAQNLTELTVTRVDNQVGFKWGSGSPSPLIDAETFSCRWTGWVEPAYSQVYTFYTVSDDGQRLWFDGQLVIDDWTTHGDTERSFTTAAPLVAGQRHTIKMEMFEQGGGATAMLKWSSATQRKQVISEIYLTPGTGEGDANAYREGDWIRNPTNGHYYKMTSAMTWEQARDQAVAWGGYLTTINDAVENDWVRQMFCPFGNPWIGANDIEAEGVWEWVETGGVFWNGNSTGTLAPGMYANWASGEPNNSGGVEDMGQIYGGNGVWNDNSPTYVQRGVVETNVGRINFSNPHGGNIWKGDSFVFIVQVRKPFGAVTYQWKKDGVNVNGATFSTYVIDSAEVDQAGLYTCVITDESPAVVETAPVRLTVWDQAAVPASGLAGLAVLASLCAAASAFVLRKGKSRS